MRNLRKAPAVSEFAQQPRKISTRHLKLDLRSDEAAANEPFWTGGEGPRAGNQRQRRATAVSPFERRSALIGAELDVGDEEERDGRPCLNLMESAVTTTHRQRRRRVSGGAWARVLPTAKVSDC
ncbi:hypothetical protein LWI28_000270 [Acer negundo]|uniref:Uncharacterized protein n=1 Tax=Acer negundo TaxID=4023 RepID=A0AAD5I7Z1_ACENE|nr:hypothetical protein LWI28_000270 [Acer negundo]